MPDLKDAERFTPTPKGPGIGNPMRPESIKGMGDDLNQRVRWLWERLQDVVGRFAPIGSGSPQPLSVTPATDTFGLTAHGLVNGDEVVLVPSRASALPAPLAFGPSYFVIGATSDTFAVSLTSGGAAVPLTNGGLGEFFVARRATPLLGAYAKLAALAAQTGTSGADLLGVTGQVGSAFTYPDQTLQAFIYWLSDHVVTLTLLGDTTSGGDAIVGVAGYSGASFPITPGSLQAYLHLLSDKAARLDGFANVFDGILRAALIAPSAGGSLSVPVGAHAAYGITEISTSATSATVDASSPVWRANAWNGGATLVVTLADYAGTDEPVIKVVWYPTTSAKTVQFWRPAGGSPAVSITGAGAAIWRWSQASSSWRYEGPGPFSMNQASVVVSTP